MERFWKWFDEKVLFRPMPRFDAFLCHPWFLPGFFVALAAGMAALIFSSN